MKMRVACLYLFGCLGVVGCSHAVRPHSQTVPDAARLIVEKEVAAVIRIYMAGYSAARCGNETPFSPLVSDRIMDVTARKVVWVPFAETERQLLDSVCGWVSQSGTVDSV